MWYGCLAQLEEHLPYKQRVSGSSPLTPTIIFFEKKPLSVIRGRVAKWLNAVDCKSIP